MVFGQWSVMPVQCCAGARRRVPKHSTAQAWPTGQTPPSALAKMTQYPKSSAFLKVEHPLCRQFEVQNLSRIYHEPIVNLSWIYREPIVNLIIVHLSRIYRESVAKLLWSYGEPIPDASHLKCVWRTKFMKIMKFDLKGSIWLGMSSY